VKCAVLLNFGTYYSKVMDSSCRFDLQALLCIHVVLRALSVLLWLWLIGQASADCCRSCASSAASCLQEVESDALRRELFKDHMEALKRRR
jgi:hypothetical protein